jgi:diacylglycerol kinase family enzyme
MVVNPKAGAGRAAKVAAALTPLLREAGIDPVVHVCADGCEPARVAGQAATAGASMVIAIGGDGLVAGVAEGLLADDVKSPLGDGETIGVLPAVFRIRPAALTVVAALMSGWHRQKGRFSYHPRQGLHSRACPALPY